MSKLEVNIAPLWRRFAALLYDGFLLTAISFGYSAALTAIAVAIRDGSPNETYNPMFSSPLFGLGWLLTLTLFYFYFWRRFGQTLGMKTWRIQVVNAQEPNAKLTSGQILIRIATGFPSLAVFAMGYLYRWFDSERDCLHDKLSKTKVVLLPKQKK